MAEKVRGRDKSISKGEGKRQSEEGNRESSVQEGTWKGLRLLG